jgi:hypothetical protein
MAREREVHKLLTQERILGLDLVMGLKRAVRQTATGDLIADASVGVAASVDPTPEEEQLTGLPLFGADNKEGDRDGEGAGGEAPR